MSTINYDWFLGKHLGSSALIFGCGLILFQQSHKNLTPKENVEMWNAAISKLHFVKLTHNVQNTLGIVAMDKRYQSCNDVYQMRQIKVEHLDALPIICKPNRTIQIISYVLLIFGVATLLPVLLVARPLIVS